MANKFGFGPGSPKFDYESDQKVWFIDWTGQFNRFGWVSDTYSVRSTNQIEVGYEEKTEGGIQICYRYVHTDNVRPAVWAGLK